jgi:hypothetical protein
VLLTWLHLADREVLQVHPRGDESIPLTGVFATRSPDRPNPIGLHRVTVLAIEPPAALRVAALEAVDGTPILDLKSAYEALTTAAAEPHAVRDARRGQDLVPREAGPEAVAADRERVDHEHLPLDAAVVQLGVADERPAPCRPVEALEPVGENPGVDVVQTRLQLEAGVDRDPVIAGRGQHRVDVQVCRLTRSLGRAGGGRRQRAGQRDCGQRARESAE